MQRQPTLPGRIRFEREQAGGEFRRMDSRFRSWISADGSSEFPAEAGRYHLYVSWACPWAHRTAIGRRLKQLEGAIGLSVADPIRDDRGWAFTGGEYTDEVNGWRVLSEACAATDPATTAASACRCSGTRRPGGS